MAMSLRPQFLAHPVEYVLGDADLVYMHRGEQDLYARRSSSL